MSQIFFSFALGWIDLPEQIVGFDEKITAQQIHKLNEKMKTVDESESITFVLYIANAAYSFINENELRVKTRLPK